MTVLSVENQQSMVCQVESVWFVRNCFWGLKNHHEAGLKHELAAMGKCGSKADSFRSDVQ